MKLNKRDWILAITGLAAGILIAIIILPTGLHDHGDSVHDHAEEDTEWTCSMHPQIRQDEPGDCPLCGMDLIPVSDTNGGSAHSGSFTFTMSVQAAALANVRTKKAEIKTTGRDINLTGKIVVNEQSISSITTDFSGRIEQLWINYTGQEVRKGERLVSIYSPELITAQKELIEAAKVKGDQPRLYEAAKTRLKLWNITDAQIEGIEESGEISTSFDIHTNSDGIIKTRQVSQGDYISRGQRLFDVASLSNVWVFLDAYESDLQWLNAGNEVTFTVGAYPGEEFVSKISWIDPVINPDTRTTNIRLEVENQHQRFKPGMFVSASVSSQIEPSLQVPVSSVMWTGPRSVVYVKIPDEETPTFEMREVTIGVRAGENQVIKSGLEPGEQVVVNGTFAVDAAAQLRGNYSMMHRPLDKLIAVPQEFRNALSQIIEVYISVKNALVESDLTTASHSAMELTEKTDQISNDALSADAEGHWHIQKHQILHSAGEIQEAESLENARTAFEKLSESVLDIMERFRPGDETFFVNYCPMAFDDEGAYWLSEVEKILNPYFGDAMLMCGEITKTFEVKNAEELGVHAGHVH
ncbi:efflux RND transporter periplasmic adaptor subunit [Alkalitalea saponilacus]|uniref:Membrane fusion protein, Cu(I)/Ag(I) efflux system n=1 Tax=Alkalitalea saponilacus TaxID=889453 RepID=A0A1T5CMF2_9BACT|nr:efflux RND transporter periplasmic adaptor subunit [Alkalitalea saponilacus]ASB49914.1 efflux RND transporter periplasmic adaptor subunit [Alkalitalea saponilacus]SKB60513.1 membrane fusion protein, Cu(I)/Ag(I) efflux system [Alkalitalea saponilacus]